MKKRALFLVLVVLLAYSANVFAGYIQATNAGGGGNPVINIDDIDIEILK